MNGVIGTIWMFGGNFAPRNWALCDGQIMSISQNTALFSIVGTIYGGNGRTTFGLPEMRGRVPMHAGRGPGLTSKSLGQRSGIEAVTLATSQIPTHNHPTTVAVSNEDGEEPAVSGQFLANHTDAFSESSVSGQTLGGVTSSNIGGNLPHNNIQPYLAVNFVICLFGIYPSRN